MRGNKGEVIIVGGGIIGCATAYFLSKEGLRVEVIEADAIGSQASGVAVGLLAPLLGMGNSGPLLQFGLQGLEFMRHLIPQLEEDTGIDIHRREAPILLLAFSSKEELAYRGDMEWRNATGLAASWLDQKEIIAIEASVNPEIIGASLLVGQIQVESYSLVLAFARSAERLGVVFRSGRVTGFTCQGNRVAGLILSSGKYLQADAFVLATGAWSQSLGSELGQTVPVEPERGQLVNMDTMDNKPAYILYHNDTYVLSLTSGLIQAGTTREKVGFNSKPTERGNHSIISQALSLYPSLSEAHVVQTLAGLRPMSSDGVPIIGPFPGWDNIYIATGHGRKGILLSAVTGRAIAQLITCRKVSQILSPFEPSRFLEI
ncbi:NAD(P)/FAD-dependent oxidoreductase [Chloroflexota bacterium]